MHDIDTDIEFPDQFKIAVENMLDDLSFIMELPREDIRKRLITCMTSCKFTDPMRSYDERNQMLADEFGIDTDIFLELFDPMKDTYPKPN